jgi:hypothetical protein
MAKQPAAWGFKDRSDAEILKQVARERRVDPRLFTGGEVGQLPNSAHHYARFVNDSGLVIPPHALLVVTGSTVIGGHEYYVVDRASTTFHPKCVVNSHLEVAADSDAKGICIDKGRVRVLFDDADAIENEQGWGPVPGSFEAGLGHPCAIQAVGEYEEGSGSPLLLGTLSPIGTLLCKATAQNSAGSLATDTSDYTIMSGTAGSETSAGFTTQPAIYSRSDIMINEWFYATFRNGTWYADLDDNSWLGKADGDIDAAASGTISLWTGTPGSETDSTSNATSVYNRTSVDIPSGGWVHIIRVNGKFYCEPWSCP